MTLNESTIEAADLTWSLLRPVRQAQGYGGQVGDQPSLKLRLTRLGYAVGHGPYPSRTLATLRDPATAGLPKLLSGELSVAGISATVAASA